jgi:hypothetical protein
MTMQFESLLKPVCAILLAWNVAACTSPSTEPSSMPTPAAAPTPTASSRTEAAERHVASIRNARAQETGHVNALAAAVSAEPRNDAWAAQKEAELRRSSAAEQRLPRGALKSVNCRSSKCDLQLEVSGAPAAGRTDEQWAAINYWIAASQPCGYTMAPAPGSTQAARAVRIFLDCGK